jgi:hypothetical protein
MASISTWSTTAANNNAAPPDGWPEGQPPNTVNDCAREMMASLRTQFENAEWMNFGHTPTRTGATTFTVSGDQTGTYVVQRRIKCTDSSTLYGTITASSFGAGITTVTVVLDSGSLTASLSAVAIGIIHPSNISIPSTLGRKGANIASAATTNIANASGDFVDVTGTTTITALGTANAGVVRVVRFTGILTLTHNGTSLILPNGVNITTASNDVATFRSLGSGNWICVSYTKAVSVASKTVMEAATALDVFVTPGRQQYHPGSIKVGANVSGDGTTILASYNTSSIVDSGTGLLTINFTTAFSSTSFAAIGTLTTDSTLILIRRSGFGLASSAAILQSVTTGGVATDPHSYGFLAIGSQ